MSTITGAVISPKAVARPTSSARVRRLVMVALLFAKSSNTEPFPCSRYLLRQTLKIGPWSYCRQDDSDHGIRGFDQRRASARCGRRDYYASGHTSRSIAEASRLREQWARSKRFQHPAPRGYWIKDRVSSNLGVLLWVGCCRLATETMTSAFVHKGKIPGTRLVTLDLAATGPKRPVASHDLNGGFRHGSSILHIASRAELFVVRVRLFARLTFQVILC